MSKIASPLVKKLLEVDDFSETFNEMMTNPKHAKFQNALKNDAEACPNLFKILKKAAKDTPCEESINKISNSLKNRSL